MPRQLINTRRTLTHDSPMNDRAVKPAVDSILHYAQMEKKRTLNALEAGQIQGILYNFKEAGLKCTCTTKTTVLSESGDLEAPNIYDYLLTGSTTTKPNFVADDMNLATDSGIDLDDPNDCIDTLTLSGNVGYDANSCACCYGSGYIGGFTISRHFYHTFAVPTKHVLSGVTIDTSVSPHAFAPEDEQSYVEFSLTVPKDSKFLTFRLMDNDTVVPYANYTVLYQAENLSWVPATDLSALAVGRPVLIRVQTEYVFTHFDVLFRTSDRPIFIDFPQLRGGDLERHLQGTFLETEMNLGPDAVGLTKYSVIYDFKYRRFWQVANLTSHLSGEDRNQVVFLDAEVRLVQDHEILAVVPIGRKL